MGEEIAGEVAAIVRKYLNKDGIGVYAPLHHSPSPSTPLTTPSPPPIRYVQASTLGSLEALLEFLKTI